MSISRDPLPLFPLDVVLFPGMVLPLHIFEMRYRKMINYCLRRDQPFGLVWSEQEPLEMSDAVRLVGTTARITESRRIADGRYNITTVGSERFVVHDLHHHEPYLTGRVEAYPLQQRAHPLVPMLSQQLVPLLTDYLELLADLAERELGPERMPVDDAMLAYVVAVYYQCQNWRKQELLQIESLPDLMRQEIDLLRTEIPLLRETVRRKETGRFPPLYGGTVSQYGLN
ncbi:MAG: LON peptidase substrate-binding domain-containing protein [Anaerolineales bacterium]|nr:LON peptidase substrate-binding domain-containing protein [Anaerolineales bacterium]MCB9171632.1 LON peptidase substrate-binding domain-containing protein [Ardenticatenales bacterium]